MALLYNIKLNESIESSIPTCDSTTDIEMVHPLAVEGSPAQGISPLNSSCGTLLCRQLNFKAMSNSFGMSDHSS